MGDSHFSGMVYSQGAPLLPGLYARNVFWCDPTNGSDDNNGKNRARAKATLKAAYDLCADAKHDVVFFIAGASAWNPTVAFDWAKSYTHLIGVGSPLPGMGQRCRIVNTGANDLAILFTLSGSGCIIANLQLFDGKDSAANGAALLVSGNRNYLRNVFVAGMGDATASGPATRAASYSAKVTGAENCFEDCTFGLDTIARTAANAELIVAGAHNRFKHCDIRSYSTTAGKFLVKIDNTADLRDTIFDACLFLNYTPNWVTGITDAFNIPATGPTYNIILRGNCQLVGVGTGWADVVTHIYGAGPAPNNGYGISIAPST